MDVWALAVAAAVIAGYAALSRRLANTPITVAIVFVATGFVLGGEGLGWLHLSFNEHSVSVLAEATLVLVLFTDASRIDLRALRREYAVPARLLSIGLPLTIVAGAVVSALILPGVTFAEAGVLAIMLAIADVDSGRQSAAHATQLVFAAARVHDRDHLPGRNGKVDTLQGFDVH